MNFYFHHSGSAELLLNSWLIFLYLVKEKDDQIQSLIKELSAAKQNSSTTSSSIMEIDKDVTKENKGMILLKTNF